MTAALTGLLPEFAPHTQGAHMDPITHTFRSTDEPFAVNRALAAWTAKTNRRRSNSMDFGADPMKYALSTYRLGCLLRVRGIVSEGAKSRQGGQKRLARRPACAAVP